MHEGDTGTEVWELSYPMQNQYSILKAERNENYQKEVTWPDRRLLQHSGSDPECVIEATVKILPQSFKKQRLTDLRESRQVKTVKCDSVSALFALECLQDPEQR